MVTRNEELAKLRANIKGLGERIQSEFESKSSSKNAQTPSNGDFQNIFSHPSQYKDFTFQPLGDKTNLSCKSPSSFLKFPQNPSISPSNSTFPLSTSSPPPLATLNISTQNQIPQKSNPKRKSMLYSANEAIPSTSSAQNNSKILVEDSIDTYNSLATLDQVTSPNNFCRNQAL